MITQKELREKWGIDAGQLSRMVKRGMPLTSESDAQRWRLANQKRVSKSQIARTPSPISSEPLKDSDAESYKSKTSLGRLNRAKQAEVVAYSLVATAANNQNPVAMRAAVQGWGEAKKRVAEAEMEHARWEEVSRVTVRMGEVQEWITKWHGAIRSLLDALPSSLAARANPSDPECAKQAIQDGINQIFITIQKAEGAFK
jgi:hypothetical protein